jgi:hypothetical protein
MITRSRPVTSGLALLFVLALVACGPGGGGGVAAPTESAPAATDAVDIQPTPTDAPTPAGADNPPPGQGPSGIDWATVDLTTIDWATIDMRQVNWLTIEDNPTAENLDRATIDLIASRVNRGSAKLTIGDQVWEFDNFLCAFGHVATKSELFSFSSLGTGQFDGVGLRLQVDIDDPSGEGRLEGPNVRQEVTLDDGEADSINWSAEGSDLAQIDGYSVTASGGFIDYTVGTLRPAEVPGTLAATCGDGSYRSP